MVIFSLCSAEIAANCCTVTFTIEFMPLILIIETKCILAQCDYPKSHYWILCEECNGWWHKICVGLKDLSDKEAETIVFICPLCTV